MSKKEEIITVRPNTLRSENSSFLSMNEQRVLFYSIFKIQTNSTSVSFTKQEMEELFNVDFGSWKEIKNYLLNLRNFGMDVISEKTQKMSIINAFVRLDYDNGLFTFKFTEDFLPAINNQKRFLQYGMTSIGKFHCKYSIYLYDYLKDSMWGDISLKKNISLHEFKSIFKLNDDKYVGRNTSFKSRVWGPAMNEINTYTHYRINIVSNGRGNNTTYDIHRIINEDFTKVKKIEEKKQFKCGLGKNLIDSRCSECMKINICPFNTSINIYDSMIQDGKDSNTALNEYMQYQFWRNKYYSLMERVNNRVASGLERRYYDLAINEARILKRLCNEDENDINIEDAIREKRDIWNKMKD